jgi:hypothetical protein
MRRGRRSLAIGLAVSSIAMATYSASTDLTPTVAGAQSDVSPFMVVPVALFIWGTPLLGLLLALRRPDNRIGWLFLLLTIGWTSSFASDDLARHTPPSTLVAAIVAIGQQLGALGYASLFALLMLFPTGRLPGRRWRVLAAALVVGAASGALGGLLAPGNAVQPPVPGLDNPFASPSTQGIASLLAAAGQAAFLGVAFGSVVLLGVRFRRSRGAEREQLKWFVSAGAASAALFLGALASETVDPNGQVGNVLWSLATMTIVLLPLAATVAILRYRLYDIDRIISRTIAYAIVTAILGGAYLAAFLAIQAALAPLTAGRAPAVAASTLVVFALFTPVRRRITVAVDRRFNRARYDAEREVAAFTARVRDEVDVRRVGDALTTTLRSTMQPTSVALWLRTEER